MTVSIDPFDRSTVRRSRSRSRDRSRSSIALLYAFFRAVAPRFDLGAIAPLATRARAHTAARGALTTVRSRRRVRALQRLQRPVTPRATTTTTRIATPIGDDANRDDDGPNRDDDGATTTTTTTRGTTAPTTTRAATRTRTTTVDARTRDDGRRGVARRRARERIDWCGRQRTNVGLKRFFEARGTDEDARDARRGTQTRANERERW